MDLTKTRLVSLDLFDTLVTMKHGDWPIHTIMQHRPNITSDELKEMRQLIMVKNQPIHKTLLEHDYIARSHVDAVITGLAKETATIDQVKGLHQLSRLIRTKKLQVAVTSNLGFEFGMPAMEKLPFIPDFALLSYQEQCTKPGPEIFQRLIKQSGLEPNQIWHIGNSFRNDYEGARSVGMNASHLDLKNEKCATYRALSLKDISTTVYYMAKKE